MFQKILIANRGEIACRVAATARRLGIHTVAVYSDADADAPHVAACDEAVHIGPPPARDSYLLGQRILAAARATGAQAIHPGYGFLSENEAFAQACADAGVVFIGPPPAAIRAMGLKAASKQLMEQAGVPLVPGYHGADQDPDLLRREAARIGYPVLIKASAGGGGKGMRVVEREADFDAALASCQREAINAFGDDAVLIERYLQRPRHIEVQVFADTHGQVVHLFERDCSVQRRHQKVLEEAPAPGMPPALRQRMGEAAVAAARAVGYVGAGTVEFIAEADLSGGQFFFMEMNTRLQVEHPVTEMITGHDLVEWQLRVAAGQPLPVSQDGLRIQGHAIEARLYAENPARGFLPSIGTLQHFRLPAHAAFQHRQGDAPVAFRVDAGVREGDAISPHYDPMIAKLIVWGADREQALLRLDQLLAGTEVVGVQTNLGFLRRVVTGAAFASGDVDTGLIARGGEALLEPWPADLPLLLAAATAAHLQAESRLAGADPWSARDGWRIGQAVGCPAMRSLAFSLATIDGPLDLAVDLSYGPQGVVLDGQPLSWRARGERRLSVRWGEHQLHATVVPVDEQWHVVLDGQNHVFTLPDPLAHAAEGSDAGGGLTAPMPGKVIAWMVAEGDRVKAGQVLAVMEAMKMEHAIHAPRDGIVAALRYAVGDQVAEGAALLDLQTTPEGEAHAA